MSKNDLIKKWEYARKMFMHYSIRYIYDSGDGYRRRVSLEERIYCKNMADFWDQKIKELRNQIEFCYVQ